MAVEVGTSVKLAFRRRATASIQRRIFRDVAEVYFAMVTTGEPNLVQDAPIEVHQSRRLFTSDAPHAHYSASLAQLSSGRLVLVYSWSPGIQRRNNGVLLTSRSDDDGANVDDA